jgi:hypothetical protein
VTGAGLVAGLWQEEFHAGVAKMLDQVRIFLGAGG